MIQSVLRLRGHEVLAAGTSLEALLLAMGFSGEIGWLITDPENRRYHNGIELAACLHVLWPEAETIFLGSGLDSDPAGMAEASSERIRFIACPESPDDVLGILEDTPKVEFEGSLYRWTKALGSRMPESYWELPMCKPNLASDQEPSIGGSRRSEGSSMMPDAKEETPRMRRARIFVVASVAGAQDFPMRGQRWVFLNGPNEDTHIVRSVAGFAPADSSDPRRKP